MASKILLFGWPRRKIAGKKRLLDDFFFQQISSLTSSDWTAPASESAKGQWRADGCGCVFSVRPLLTRSPQDVELSDISIDQDNSALNAFLDSDDGSPDSSTGTHRTVAFKHRVLNKRWALISAGGRGAFKYLLSNKN